MQNGHFNEDSQVPLKLSWQDIEALTKKEVLGMKEWGRKVVFILDNGMKIHIPKW